GVDREPRGRGVVRAARAGQGLPRLIAARRAGPAPSGSAGQQRGELFGWGAPAECLAGSAVELVGDRVQLGLADGVEVDLALGEVLTQQPVGVLVRPALPGTVRVAE